MIDHLPHIVKFVFVGSSSPTQLDNTPQPKLFINPEWNLTSRSDPRLFWGSDMKDIVPGKADFKFMQLENRRIMYLFIYF